MIKRVIDLLKTYDDPRVWWKNVTWRFPRTISDARVVFIVGAPRSGTTLLQRMLTVHSQLFSIEGETGLFSFQNIFAKKSRHFRLIKEISDSLLAESTDVVDFFSNAVTFLSQQNEGRLFVEKTPQHALHVAFILKHFPAAKIIHIVRDGRDCYCSSKVHPHIPQNKSSSMYARYWKKCTSRVIAHESSPRVCTVQYEALVRDPPVELEKLMAFLGLRAEAEQVEPGAINQDHRSQLERFKRLKGPINDSSVMRWRSELSATESRDFERIAKNELLHYAYDLSSESS